MLENSIVNDVQQQQQRNEHPQQQQEDDSVTCRRNNEDDKQLQNESPQTTTTTSNKKRQHSIAYHEAYHNFHYIPIPSSGRPGTPHRFFDESYLVQYHDDIENINDDDPSHDDVPTKKHRRHVDHKDDVTPSFHAHHATGMIVHKHVNGLVIITSGYKFCHDKNELSSGGEIGSVVDQTKQHDHVHDDNNNNISAYDHDNDCRLSVYDRLTYHIHPSTETMSTNAKRKQQSSMLKGTKKKIDHGIIHPRDILMSIQYHHHHHHHKERNEHEQQPLDTNTKLSELSKQHDSTRAVTIPADPVVISQSTENDNVISHDSDVVRNYHLPCCVFGTILETNAQLLIQQQQQPNDDGNDRRCHRPNDDDNNNNNICHHDDTSSQQEEEASSSCSTITHCHWKQLLQQDPLLSGYLAVVLPTGPFPPPSSTAAGFH